MCPIRTVIPVSPQGKTGIPLTLAYDRKDEIPALRFAWPVSGPEADPGPGKTQL